MNVTQPDQVGRRVAQSDLAAAPLRRELEPRERVDRHRIGLDAADIAHGDAGVASLQQRADAHAEAGQVGAGDRPG